MRYLAKSLALCLFGVALILSGGCTAKAKLERHVKRADAFYAKGDFQAARIEYMNAFRLNQNDPHVASRLGESLLEVGDLERAFQVLAHARQLEPTNTTARSKVASIFLLAGKFKEARAEAEEILKLNPIDTDALVLLANSCSNTNEIAATRQRLEALIPSAPRHSGIHLALGVLAQKMGDLETAQSEYGKAIELDPKSSKANLALANIYFAQRDTNKAEIYYKAASENAPYKSLERLGYSEFLLKTGRGSEAKSFLQETTAKVPSFLGAWNMLTQIAFSEGDTNSASEFITKALAQDPDNRDALLHRARLQMVNRQFKAAVTGLERLAERYPRDSQVQHQLAIAHLGNEESAKALASLDRAVALNTNNLDAVMLRAQVQISRGDINGAIPELVRVARQAPRAPQPQFALAAAYRQRGSLAEAIAVYQTMAKNFPNDPQPHHLTATIYRQQTNFPAARVNYEAALKVNPDFLPAIDDLIELDVFEGKHSNAMSRVQVYIEKYPDKPMPRLLQAKALFGQERNEEAEAAVKKAIELDPEFYPAHRALADFYARTKQIDSAIEKLESMIKRNEKDIASHLQAGMLYETKRDYAKARASYEAVLRLNPKSVAALNNLAYILSEQVGDYDAALQHARYARELAPYDPYTADTYGWILLNKGDHAGALAAIQQSADRLPGQAEVQYHLGLAYYLLGSPDQARAAFEKAVASSEDFKGKDKARTTLALLNLDPARATPDHVAQLQKVVEANPVDVLAWTKLAEVHEAKGAFDKARDSYEKAVKVNPRSTLLLSRLALLYAGPLGNPSRGLELAKQAWSISQNPDLASVVGPVGYNAGDLRWAYGVLLEAQRAPEAGPEIRYYLGLASYAFGRIPESLDDLQAASRAALPSDLAPLARSAATIVAFHAGKATAAEAEAAITAASALNPAFPPALIGAGLVAEHKNDFNGARAKYEQAIKASPGFLIAQRQLALLLANRLADDAKASELATSLRQDFSADSELTAALGKIAYRRGDYAEAARMLRTVSVQPGSDPELLYYLGMAQYHLKDRAAKETLTRAVAGKPDARLAADARKALTELDKK